MHYGKYQRHVTSCTYTTYQLSSPSCSIRATHTKNLNKKREINYCLTSTEVSRPFRDGTKKEEWTISRKMTRQKEHKDYAEKQAGRQERRID